MRGINFSGRLWLPTAIYYSQRLVVNPLLRGLVVGALGAWIGKRTRGRQSVHPLVGAVRERGIVQFGQLLSDAKCAEVLAYLSDKPVYDDNVTISHVFSDGQPADMSFGIHAIEDVLDCPHIMELVSASDIVDLAEDYLGCNPTLSCLGIAWSFPTQAPRIAQTFHRDSEGWKYLRFLIYLTDVDAGCGPHVYVAGSHKGTLPLRLKSYSPEELSQRYGADSLIKVYGKRGTGLAADTSGIHKGELPEQGPRLALHFTYSILRNPFSEYKPILSRHSPGLCNYTNRLFLR